MLPGSILTTSLQVAAADRQASATENEEEYAQRFGHIARLSPFGKLNLFVRPFAWVVYAILFLAYVLA